MPMASFWAGRRVKDLAGRLPPIIVGKAHFEEWQWLSLLPTIDSSMLGVTTL